MVLSAERYVPAGILCLAISLLVKPHDAGLVWLYFLLAGSANRKRAMQTLLVTAVLALPFILWVSCTSPHWMQEMNSNLSAHSATGDDSDPGPRGVIAWTHGAQLISLQTMFSVFRDDPRFYNPATYLVCGLLLILWAECSGAITPDRRKFMAGTGLCRSSLHVAHLSPPAGYEAVASRFPAFAILWAERGLVRWFAFLVTAAGVLFTGDSSLQILGLIAHNIGVSVTSPSGKLLTLFLARPAPIALLVVSVFYLGVCLRRQSVQTDASNPVSGYQHPAPVA